MKPRVDPPKSVADLMAVTGLGRDSVRAGIRTGELPGYVRGRKYVIPAQAFEDFCHGRWTPQFRPTLVHVVKNEAEPQSLIRRIEPAAKGA